MSRKNSNDTIGNRTRDLLACSSASTKCATSHKTPVQLTSCRIPVLRTFNQSKLTRLGYLIPTCRKCDENICCAKHIIPNGAHTVHCVLYVCVCGGGNCCILRCVSVDRQAAVHSIWSISCDNKPKFRPTE